MNKIATTLLADSFGVHMSFLGIDEHLSGMLEPIEFSRSSLIDINHCDLCATGLIEGGVCIAKNVHVLRRYSTSKTQ